MLCWLLLVAIQTCFATQCQEPSDYCLVSHPGFQLPSSAASTANGFLVQVNKTSVCLIGKRNRMPMGGMDEHIQQVQKKIPMDQQYFPTSENCWNEATSKNTTMGEFFASATQIIDSAASARFVALVSDRYLALIWDSKEVTLVYNVAQVEVSMQQVYYLQQNGKVYVSSSISTGFEQISIIEHVSRITSHSNSEFLLAQFNTSAIVLRNSTIHSTLPYKPFECTISADVVYSITDSTAITILNLTSGITTRLETNWGVLPRESVLHVFEYERDLYLCSWFGTFKQKEGTWEQVYMDRCIDSSMSDGRICLRSLDTTKCWGNISDLYVSPEIPIATTVLMYIFFAMLHAQCLILLIVNACYYKYLLHWIQQVHIACTMGASICHIIVINLSLSQIVESTWRKNPAVMIGFALLGCSYVNGVIIFCVTFMRRAQYKEKRSKIMILMLLCCIVLHATFLIVTLLSVFGVFSNSKVVTLVFMVNIPNMLSIACVQTVVQLEYRQSRIRKQKKKDDMLLALAFQHDHEMLSNSSTINMDMQGMSIEFRELSELEEIGSGASGMVIKAKWKKQMVAVKLYRYSDEDMLQMFNNETQMLVCLRHENIVNILGICKEHPRYAIIMEYCANKSLLHLIKMKQLKELHVKIITDIAHGMNYLHNRNILHRDLKPDNVLISENMVAKIADFGTSKMGASESMTTRIGTSWYMAPEVVRGQEYNEKCDVFSFGILMYQVVFEAANPYGSNVAPEMEYLVAKNASYRPVIPEDKVLAWQVPLVAMLKKCWDHNSMARPTFEEICFELQNLQ